MTPRVSFSVVGVSLYLLTFLIFVFTEQSTIASWMFVFSPVLIIWMVYTVIRYGQYTGPDLDDEEWGYEDRDKDDIGIF